MTTDQYPALHSFDTWLEIIKRYRDLGCPLPSDEDQTENHATWGEMVKAGQKDQWKATGAAFEQWKTDPNRWNGQTAPKWDVKPYAVPIDKATSKPIEVPPDYLTQSKHYQTIMTGLDFTAKIMPQPFSAAFQRWVLDGNMDAALQKIAKHPNTPIHYDQFRAEMLSRFGRDLMKHGDVSREFGAPPEKNLNRGYVTKVNGQWRRLSEEDVANLLKKGAEGKGPHVVITANHAFLETFKGDVEPITQGYTNLLHKVSTTKDQQAVVPIEWKSNDQQFKPTDTVMIAAIETQENNFLNLAQLFARLHEIDRANERTQPGKLPTDEFKHTSFIAKMMVSTLLKAMVVDEDLPRIKLNEKTHPPRFIEGPQPVHLRPDAAEIMRKALFFGFSKGGNDFRDGMRLLVRTLHSKNHNKAMFIPSQGTLTEIVSNIAVTAQSMNEKKMDDYYTERGVSVEYFTNAHDSIAVPPGIDYTRADPASVYNGTTSANGHTPKVITENLGLPYILQHHRCILAGMQGMPAIRFVRYMRIPDPQPGDRHHMRHALVLQTAPGTTDEMMEATAIPALEKMFGSKLPGPKNLMEPVGLDHLTVERIPGATGDIRYELRSHKDREMVGDKIRYKDTQPALLELDTVKRLALAFNALEKDRDNRVVVSTACEYPYLSTLRTDLIKAMGWKAEKGEGWRSMIGGPDGKDMLADRVFTRNMGILGGLARLGHDDRENQGQGGVGGGR